MEDPPAKRRRTSPRSSAVAVPSPTPAPAPAASQPKDAEPSSAQRKSGLRSKPRRPSFASPTKSSMARHNPEILDRREAAGAAAAAALAVQSQTPPGPPPSSPPFSSAAATSQRRGRPPKTTPSAIAEDPLSGGTAPLSSASRTRRLGGSMAAKPRRTPRPLPAPGPEADEDILQPADRSKARDLARAGVIPPATEVSGEPEPELPPTPVERGIDDPVVTTPPQGIHHSSSPSRRAAAQKTRHALGGRMKSSPLKRPPVRPADLPAVKSPKATANITKDVQDDTLRLTLDREAAAGPRNRTHPARGIPPPDPLAAQKRERDALQAEIAALEADMALVAAENERIRKQAARRPPIKEPPSLAMDKEELLRLVRDHLLPPPRDDAPPQPEQQLLHAALNPIAWLPFGRPAETRILPPAEEDELEELPAPRSHHPVAMTAAEELPYLEAFTPLSFSSTITVLPREGTGRKEGSGPLLQRHDICVRSATPPGLFAARLAVTVNAKHLTITELAVPRLDAAAVDELGAFVDGVLARPGSSALTRNVSVVCWAMGEWFRVAVGRARFWCALERETAEEDKLLAVAALARRGRKRRRRDAEDEEDEDEGDAEAREGGEQRPEVWGRGALAGHMGRTAMDIPLPAGDGGESALLRVSWRIGFDWSGEARSEVAVLVGVPGKWRHHDDRGELAKVPGIFERIVDEEDPMPAVNAVLALLVGDKAL